MPIDLSKIKAIDVHVHAEVSCHDPEDPVMGKFFDAASAYFKAPRERPKIPEIIEIYRDQQIAFCLFTVDCESGMGAKRVSNYEVAEIANKNDDICIPFASIDPHKGKYGAREAIDLIEQLQVLYQDIVLQYFDKGGEVNQAIDEFVYLAFFADISVTRVVELHMNLMDQFSKQLQLEGRSEEILLDYRLTLIDVIAHLCEMYRRSIPREPE